MTPVVSAQRTDNGVAAAPDNTRAPGAKNAQGAHTAVTGQKNLPRASAGAPLHTLLQQMQTRHWAPPWTGCWHPSRSHPLTCRWSRPCAARTRHAARHEHSRMPDTCAPPRGARQDAPRPRPPEGRCARRGARARAHFISDCAASTTASLVMPYFL
jgi:hypothetical protein